MAVPTVFPSQAQLDRQYDSPAAYMALVDLTTADAEYTGRIPVSLECATAGIVKFDGMPLEDGTATTDTVTVAAGKVIPCCVTKVWKVGTTVTELHAYFK